MQTQLQRPILTKVAWVRQVRQEPHSRDWGKGEARPVLLEQLQL